LSLENLNLDVYKEDENGISATTISNINNVAESFGRERLRMITKDILSSNDIVAYDEMDLCGDALKLSFLCADGLECSLDIQKTIRSYQDLLSESTKSSNDLTITCVDALNNLLQACDYLNKVDTSKYSQEKNKRFLKRFKARTDDCTELAKKMASTCESLTTVAQSTYALSVKAQENVTSENISQNTALKGLEEDRRKENEAQEARKAKQIKLIQDIKELRADMEKAMEKEDKLIQQKFTLEMTNTIVQGLSAMGKEVTEGVKAAYGGEIVKVAANALSGLQDSDGTNKQTSNVENNNQNSDNKSDDFFAKLAEEQNTNYRKIQDKLWEIQGLNADLAADEAKAVEKLKHITDEKIPDIEKSLVLLGFVTSLMEKVVICFRRSATFWEAVAKSSTRLVDVRSFEEKIEDIEEGEEVDKSFHLLMVDTQQKWAATGLVMTNTMAQLKNVADHFDYQMKTLPHKKPTKQYLEHEVDKVVEKYGKASKALASSLLTKDEK